MIKISKSGNIIYALVAVAIIFYFPIVGYISTFLFDRSVNIGGKFYTLSPFWMVDYSARTDSSSRLGISGFNKINPWNSKAKVEVREYFHGRFDPILQQCSAREIIAQMGSICIVRDGELPIEYRMNIPSDRYIALTSSVAFIFSRKDDLNFSFLASE